MDDFLQKLKKVVRIVLYGPAIRQSACRKAGPYQLPLIKRYNKLLGRKCMSFLKCSNLEAKKVIHFRLCHQRDKMSNYDLQ